MRAPIHPSMQGIGRQIAAIMIIIIINLMMLRLILLIIQTIMHIIIMIIIEAFMVPWGNVAGAEVAEAETGHSFKL